MNILIIGGSGRISFSVCKELIKRQHKVYVLNRNVKKNVQDTIRIICDIHERKKVKQLIENNSYDIVIDFQSYSLEDLKFWVNIFSGKIQCYYFISSMTVCQASKKIIISEDDKENNDFSLYAMRKKECEEFLKEYNQKINFPYVIIRPSQTYNHATVPLGIHGETGSWTIIKRIIDGKEIIIHGDGNSLWSATRSEDFAVWLADIVLNRNLFGEVIHLVTDEYMTWNQIYYIIANEVGKKLKAIYISSEMLAKLGRNYNLEETLLGDKSNTHIFNTDKLKKYTKYLPQKSMEQGIRESVRTILNNSQYQIEDMKFNAWYEETIERIKQITEEK